MVEKYDFPLFLDVMLGKLQDKKNIWYILKYSKEDLYTHLDTLYTVEFHQHHTIEVKAKNSTKNMKCEVRMTVKDLERKMKWDWWEEEEEEPCLPFLFCDSFQLFLSHKWAS